MTKNTRKGHDLNVGDTFTWGGTREAASDGQQATIVRADRFGAVIRLADGREFPIRPATRFHAR